MEQQAIEVSLHPRLEGALRLLNPNFPTGVKSPREAWPFVRPPAGYIHDFRKDFWGILSVALPVAKSAGRQVSIANWIIEKKARDEKAGRPWPPKVYSKLALPPQPRP